jgi:hypothetical protein
VFRLAVRVRIGRFYTDDQVLPLRVVAEEAAVAERERDASVEDRDAGRMCLLLQRQVAQAEREQRLRCAREIGSGVAVAGRAAGTEAAPAGEGRGPYMSPAQWVVSAGCRAGSEDRNRRRAQGTASRPPGQEQEQATDDGLFAPQTSLIEGEINP